MTLAQRIDKIIEDYTKKIAPSMREAYGNDYDYIHASYAGLKDDVIAELIDRKYWGVIPDSVIKEIVADYYH
jgi:hypothetical protein